MAALVVAALPTKPALASTGPWSDYYTDSGMVTVSADRKQVRVCDLDASDDLHFKAEFATDNPIDPSIYTVKAPQGGCDSDRTYISRIKVFKLCTGSVRISDVVWDHCNAPIWLSRLS
ncbi:hypothetical protein Misp02_34930 [Microtetraspora sp. NBRC 16547]|nr:hypothetical protein Misp02_34930 [Microtetraspora sp. NBRC 16547]